MCKLFVKELLFLPLGNYRDGSMVDCWREMENMSSRPALRGMGSGRMAGWGMVWVKAERGAESGRRVGEDNRKGVAGIGGSDNKLVRTGICYQIRLYP